jgi:hypothetical protein
LPSRITLFPSWRTERGNPLRKFSERVSPFVSLTQRVARIPLPPWRSALVERTGGQLRIMLRARHFFVQGALFVGAVTAWAAGGMYAFEDIAVHPARRLWTSCWLVFWVAWGVWAFPRLLWAAVGRETVVVRDREIVIRREILGIGRSRVFELNQLEDLRYALPPPVGYAPPSRGWPPQPQPRLGGSIRFRCGRRVVRFADGIGLEDMTAVLEALRERLHVASSGGSVST